MEKNEFDNNSSAYAISTYYLIPLKATLSLISIILNGYIIVLVLVIIKKKSYSNCLFLCGALADFMVGAISVPFFTILTTYNYWPLGKAACMIWQVVDASASSIGVHSPLIIAVHRYVQIRHASRVSEEMTLLSYVGLVLYWVFIYLFWTLILILPNMNDHVGWTDCSVDSVFAIALALDLICYIIPLILLLVFNTLIFVKLIERSKKKAMLHASQPGYQTNNVPRPTVIEETENSTSINQQNPSSSYFFLKKLSIFLGL